MRKLALALIAVFLVGVGTFAPATVSRASAATGPKVAIIVGATHSATSTYRSYADQIYAEAIAYTSNVVRVYSPNATWSNVKAAVNGASIVVYLGHGNGWPSPYTYDPLFTTKDGFGLNVDGDRSDYVNKYYGEPYIEDADACAERRRPAVPPVLRLRQFRARRTPSRRSASRSSESTTTRRRSSRRAPARSSPTGTVTAATSPRLFTTRADRRPAVARDAVRKRPRGVLPVRAHSRQDLPA